MFTYFRHDQLRRYIAAFGSLFSNIEIRRRDSEQADIQKLIVPVEYGPKERWLTRLSQDPDFTKSVAQVVPRIAYEKTGIVYDGSRAMKMLDQMSFATLEQRKLARLYVGVPYNLTFQVSILVKYQSDGHQIIEQILPYFRPDLTIAMQTIPELEMTETVPIIIGGVTEQDNYEGDFEKRRVILWTLDFTMRVFIYGPVRTGNRIQEVLVDIYNSQDPVLGPEIFVGLEDGLNNSVLLETGTGRLVDESTSNTYLEVGRVARIDAVATPPDQDPNANGVQAVTTITEYSGDVKRDITLVDEN